MISAVIFDCDGVLVDSEVLVHEIELAVLAELGLHYDSHDFKMRHLGTSDAAYYQALDQDGLERLGRTISGEVRPMMKARVAAVYDERLGEVPGALAAVAALRLAKAVASSSGVTALDYKLRKTGLWDHFAPHVYSAEHVAHAKPAPDLFLLAAKSLGVRPEDCLVIEDSMHGVTAGRAAGMRVWGFGGGGHMDSRITARLGDAGAERIVADWAEAEALFATL
jgi:HAD superfamily hydrolase (TIGR01509 family)